MTEKNQQEKMAAERQVELFTKAFGKAKEDNGIWLDNNGRKAPGLYQKHLQVSAFNAIILGMHAAQNGYKTNQYTLFSEAKKRGESVQSKEKGVPFLWYNWNEYVNKHNPEDKISRADYQALPSDKQADYKGIRSREVRALFNIEQTTLPMVDKTAFEATVQEYGRLNDRKDVESASTAIRNSVEELLEKARKNMVEIRSDSTGVAHYDSKKDIVFLPKASSYEHYEDYARDAVSLLVTATGHGQRLAREGMVTKNGKVSAEDAMKQERLVTEVATAVKLQELGISAKLSPESMAMTDYWSRELKENPCLIDILERDVNNAVDMLHKAERGEKVELNSKTARNQADAIKSILPKHYYVADEIKTLPNKSTKEFVLVKDAEGKMADVVLPEGASLGMDNDIPGMKKGRIEHALQKEGYETVTFYNVDGSMGYRPDDSFFDGKAVSVARLNNWSLETITLLDVSDAVKRSGAVDFDKILMLRDDEGKWALYLKPENEKAFSVYPDKADVNLFFTTVKQGDEELSDTMRQDMAQKYYMEASNKPEIKVDLFKSNVPAEEVDKIQRVNIFKTKETDNQPSVILCMPTVNGEKLKPREISPSQWQRMWLAENMQDYKKHLAASLFADVLRKDRTDAVAVGTEKSEQEAQSNEVKQNTVQQEEDKATEEQEEETTEKKEQKQKEEKAKEEKTKAETKAAVVAMTPMLKQFYELKGKHPDAVLLRKDRTDAVAVGTEKSEQEAQSNEVKQNTVQQEEDKATEEQEEETTEKKEQKQKEEKAKEEKTKAETKAAVVAMTPMLKQFYELKGKHPDAVLLFRCGDFYETYSQDAEKASKILGITLTKSSHTKDADGKPLSMAGFPYHALDTYLPKLIRAGERVAICDQLEAPKRATEEISPSKVESPQQEQNNSSGIHR